MSFPKIVNQKGSFSQIGKNSLFRFCQPILDIFGFTLLKALKKHNIRDNSGKTAIAIVCLGGVT